MHVNGEEDPIVTCIYDDNGNRLSETSGNKTAEFSYNRNNQVVGLVNKYNGNEISRYNYTYNQGGYQDSKTETIANYGTVSPELVGSKTTTYQYDLLGRLTREATGDDSISYEYDKNNNRSSMIVTQNAVDKTTNYHYNKNDELLSEATEDEGVKQITNYWYDLNGNQIAKSYANVVTNGANVVVPSITIQATTDNPEEARPQLTEYDALNRQTKVKIGNDVYKYGYNEDGLRTWKEVNGEKTYFVWDDGQIVLELDENGDVNKKHVRGLTLLYSEDDNASTDDKVFYNYNAHGDVVQLLDEAGTVTKYYQYDSFGNEINEDENDENPWRYCGEYYDKETKTIYLRARYYNPGYGRFTTEDPAQAGLNWYVYCDNEPISFVDPSGLCKINGKWIKYTSKVKQSHGKPLKVCAHCGALDKKFKPYSKEENKGVKVVKKGNYWYYDFSRPIRKVLEKNFAKTVNARYIIRGSNLFGKDNLGGIGLWFMEMVDTRCRWDYKYHKQWKKDFKNISFIHRDSYVDKGDEDKQAQFILFGKKTSLADLGNINYGWCGRTCGFPESVLLFMGGLTEQNKQFDNYIISGASALFIGSEKDFGDQKDDAEMVRLGMSWFNNGGLPKA